MRKQFEQILTAIFSVLLAICLILGFLAGIGFVIAFLAGGETAVSVCAFLNNKMLPAVYIVGAFLALLGVVKMYLAGEKSFYLALK